MPVLIPNFYFPFKSLSDIDCARFFKGYHIMSLKSYSSATHSLIRHADAAVAFTSCNRHHGALIRYWPPATSNFPSLTLPSRKAFNSSLPNGKPPGTTTFNIITIRVSGIAP